MKDAVPRFAIFLPTIFFDPHELVWWVNKLRRLDIHHLLRNIDDVTV